MRRSLVIILTCLVSVGAFVPPAVARAQTTPAIQIDAITFTSVSDWESGTTTDLRVSNNDGGELRLADNESQGIFETETLTTTFPFHAIGPVWKADTPPGTQLVLEVRAGPTPESLGEYQRFVAIDARSQNDDSRALEAALPFPPDSIYVQFRATLSATAANASPVLQEIALHYINAGAGAPLSDGLTRVPAPYGSATLTPAPQIIPRAQWGAAPVTQIGRQEPRGVIIHQIGADGIGPDPLPFLRASAAYNTQTLGWDDMPFHFVIDSVGDILEGHIGGPTAEIPRLAAGDSAIHIALIGSSTPSESAQTSLINLLAWLGEAYDIPPLERHTFTPPQGTPITLPNIAAHSEAVAEASDPSLEVRNLVNSLRQAADRATVRSRWYFAEGNPLDYAQRLSVLNISADPASVRFRLLRQPGEEFVRSVTVGAGDRFDLVVNNIFSDTTDVPSIVESNAPIIAERYMDFSTDISASPGVRQPARVWYFAEGTTDDESQTFLLLFNPQNDEVSANVTFMRSDGTTEEREVSVPPLTRTVLSVADTLPDTGFGTRVIASKPIVAERTMIFGPGSTRSEGGFHTTPGVLNLSRRWYFAEGTTQAPFQMSVLVLNPNAQSSDVAVTFQTPDGTSLTRRYAIPPTSRLAIDVNEVVPDLGVATTVQSDRPVAVERALYWRDRSVGTVNAGAVTPAFTWRFADGRTSGEFQQYLLFNNTSPNQARVAVEFVQANGTRGTQTIVMPGGSRYTMAVHELYPGQTAIAATVRSTQPIVVERSMYPGAPAGETNRGGSTAFGVPEVEP
jgi:hypothetical protein